MPSDKVNVNCSQTLEKRPLVTKSLNFIVLFYCSTKTNATLVVQKYFEGQFSLDQTHLLLLIG